MAARTALPGRFVWHDLTTGDTKRGIEFYKGLFGWTVEEWKTDKGTYPMFKSGELAWGGAMDPQMPGVPPHWLCYVSVADVDRACQAASRMGGKVVLPAMDIPEVGRFAVVTDPQGAVFAPFTGVQEMPEPPPERKPGEFCWYQLRAGDPKALVGFYAELFGWDIRPGTAGGQPVLQVSRGGTPIADFVAIKGDGAHWLPYVVVDELGAALARAEKLGGLVAHPATDLPGMGCYAHVTDPVGASIGLWAGNATGK
jgi:hypothetical protein